MVPYREQAEEAAEIAKKREAPSIGDVRSVHAVPHLAKALLGPFLISGILFAVFEIAEIARSPSREAAQCGGGGSTLHLGGVGLALSLAVFALLAWQPLRTRGQVVAVHTEGLVLTKGGARTEIFFEDVNEIWIEIPRLHSTKGAYARALVLLDFAGTKHRIPLTVHDGAILGNAILHACSMPLLTDARKAIKEGHTLHFGTIGISAKGLTVNRTFLAWIDIRRVDITSSRVLVYRKRSPIFAWTSIKLDRIPNASIFCALVADNAESVQRNERLLVELPSRPGVAERQAETARLKSTAIRNVIVGGVLVPFGVSIALSDFSWRLGGVILGAIGVRALVVAYRAYFARS